MLKYNLRTLTLENLLHSSEDHAITDAVLMLVCRRVPSVSSGLSVTWVPGRCQVQPQNGFFENHFLLEVDKGRHGTPLNQ